MKIAIGADHRGYRAKEFLEARLRQSGHELIDCGAADEARSDHPLFAYRVGRLVAERKADRGILVCGTGVGMEIAANKIPGVRAVLGFNRDIARLGRSHNDANVITLPGDHCPLEEMWELVRIFLSTEFLGGRYQKRVDMYRRLEDTGKLDNGTAACPGDSACTT